MTSPAPRKRILFVDDEPAILSGLQTLLYKERKRWDMVFALGGQLALDELRKGTFDIVVSDMRMPGIDGAALLNQIKNTWPETVRIMLSGFADRDAMARALPALHHLLTKPCDANTLRSTLERSMQGTDVDRDTRIRAIVGSVTNLPTPPDLYFELCRLVQSPTTTTADVAAVVARDPALAAKVLQLVNSAFFGARKATASIQQAVSLLGLDQLRYLALTATVFSGVEPNNGSGFSVKDLQEGALRAAVIARTIASAPLRDQAFAATLLHDLGHFVLASARGPDYRTFAERARGGEDCTKIELELFGVTHADIGGRLLSVWGLPVEIVDAVQYHHDPGSAPASSRLLASIVHVADALGHETAIDMASLERAGSAQLVDGWRALVM